MQTGLNIEILVSKSIPTRTDKFSCGLYLDRRVYQAVIILNVAEKRAGDSRINATGVGISTLVSENLLE